ncbi:MAG: hypothetical protein GX614_01620 [Sandaracinaceae bacterium]|nr:hypothetical protein [Sandaracinaceae bacterium]
MYSIALVTFTAIALGLGAIVIFGIWLAATLEKRRGTIPIPTSTRAPATSADISLFLRFAEDSSPIELSERARARKGLIDAGETHDILNEIKRRIDEIKSAQIVYAAPQLLQPYRDGEPGRAYRLRLRSRRPFTLVDRPLNRARIVETLDALLDRQTDEIIVAHFEEVKPRRDRSLPRFEDLT